MDIPAGPIRRVAENYRKTGKFTKIQSHIAEYSRLLKNQIFIASTKTSYVIDTVSKLRNSSSTPVNSFSRSAPEPTSLRRFRV